MSSSKWRLETPVASYLCSAHYLITRTLWPLSLSLSLSLSLRTSLTLPAPPPLLTPPGGNSGSCVDTRSVDKLYKLRTQRDFQLNKSGNP